MHQAHFLNIRQFAREYHGDIGVQFGPYLRGGIWSWIDGPIASQAAEPQASERVQVRLDIRQSGREDQFGSGQCEPLIETSENAQAWSMVGGPGRVDRVAQQQEASHFIPHDRVCGKMTVGESVQVKEL